MNAISIDSGTIKIFGLDSMENEIEIKKRLGFVSDKIYFSEFWTAKDINSIMGKIHPDWDSRTFTEFLEKHNLPLEKSLKELSNGMQSRLVLSSVFSRNTELLVLDEPTSGLDPVMHDEFLTLIKKYIRDGEKSVLYSTHITTDLEKAINYITFINAGHLVFSEEADILRESYYIVKDSLDVLSKIRSLCIGISKNQFGFEALISQSDLRNIPNTCIRQPASIDEIITFYNRKEAD